MKVTAILLMICLFFTGCAATTGNNIPSELTNILAPRLPKGSSAEDNSKISKDTEDQTCGDIPYEKRTVCRIQVHLNCLKYSAGTPDGIAGQRTKTAIRQYQQKSKIQPADGKPSYALLTQLRKDNLKGNNPLLTGTAAGLACGALAKYMNKNAAAWALACGAGGTALQYMANKGREDYAMRYYEIKDENEKIEQEISDISKQTKDNEKLAENYEKRTHALIKEERNNQKFLVEAKSLREELSEQVRQNKNTKREAEIKIAILENQIKDMNEILSQKPDEQEFTKTLAVLEERKTKLVNALNSSNELDKELLAQKQILDKEMSERS